MNLKVGSVLLVVGKSGDIVRQRNHLLSLAFFMFMSFFIFCMLFQRHTCLALLFVSAWTIVQKMCLSINCKSSTKRCHVGSWYWTRSHEDRPPSRPSAGCVFIPCMRLIRPSSLLSISPSTVDEKSLNFSSVQSKIEPSQPWRQHLWTRERPWTR